MKGCVKNLRRASYCGVKFFVELNPAPARLLPNWAKLYGVKVSVMQGYCTNINHRDKLPRGMEKKLEALRARINQMRRSA